MLKPEGLREGLRMPSVARSSSHAYQSGNPPESARFTGKDNHAAGMAAGSLLTSTLATVAIEAHVYAGGSCPTGGYS